MKHITIKLLSTASLLMAAGQVSAHVSYGPALFDGANDASSVLHLATTNLTAQSTQTLTATSNAGNLEDHNATTWGNSHDNKFQWFSISQPTNISFSITGNANNSYTSLQRARLLARLLRQCGRPDGHAHPGYSGG